MGSADDEIRPEVLTSWARERERKQEERQRLAARIAEERNKEQIAILTYLQNQAIKGRWLAKLRPHLLAIEKGGHLK